MSDDVRGELRYCEPCDRWFEPLHDRELCPRDDKVAAERRVEELEKQLQERDVQLEGLEVALREMNAIISKE